MPNQDNIVDTLATILNNAEHYIQIHKINGKYHIDNPSYVGDDMENFADKWNEHPERADAFIKWIRKAKTDLLAEDIFELNRLQMAENIKSSFGQITRTHIFNDMAEEDKKAIIDHKNKIETATGAISASGSIDIPTNHHHGS